MELSGGRLACLLAALFLSPVADAAPVTAPGQQGSATTLRAAEYTKLRQVFVRDAARADELDPLGALNRGEAPDPDMVALLLTDKLDRLRLTAARQSLNALHQVDRTALSPEAQISYDVFESSKRTQIDWLQPDIRALTGVRPFNHFSGLHVEFPAFMSNRSAVPFASEADYRHALNLDTAFARVLDNAVLRFREGLTSGVVESRLTVRNMIGQIDAMLDQPIEQSPFYSPVLAFPETVPAHARKRLREDFALVIRDGIHPAYARLRTFLAEEYLPAAREEPGIQAMKGGAALYRRLIERETTLALEPEDVHQLGLAEVARIRGEMEKVKGWMGYSGSLESFFDHIRDTPQYHPATREELIDGYAAIARKVDTQIPRFFSSVPKTPLQVMPFPAFRERYEPGGSYYQGSADGSRPGVFYFNTFDLPGRFLTGMATLYLHEAIPGHHFQISMAQENERLPTFQRFEGNNAFIEGWALYAETLGYEMGLYDDPQQHWGTLDDEMLRAMRLVVDTGIHVKGWGRERAIEYMLANSGMGRTDAGAEVERYVANPAQALSYKIGSLTIQDLRAEAERALGNKFDIHAFHAQILGSGALPLPILRAKIEAWIVASRR